MWNGSVLGVELIRNVECVCTVSGTGFRIWNLSILCLALINDAPELEWDVCRVEWKYLCGMAVYWSWTGLQECVSLGTSLLAHYLCYGIQVGMRINMWNGFTIMGLQWCWNELGIYLGSQGWTEPYLTSVRFFFFSKISIVFSFISIVIFLLILLYYSFSSSFS